MIRYRCDGCGTELSADGSNHFIVKIEAFAAAGKLEFSGQEVAEAGRGIEETLRALAVQHPDDIEDGVYRNLRFDLCPACHRRYLRSPLGGLKGEAT